MSLSCETCQYCTCSTMHVEPSWFLGRWKSVPAVLAHLPVPNLFGQMLTETLKLPWPKPLIGFRGPLIWLSGSPCLLLEINECSSCSATPFVLQGFSPLLEAKLNNGFSGVYEERMCRQMHIYNLYRCVVM